MRTRTVGGMRAPYAARRTEMRETQESRRERVRLGNLVEESLKFTGDRSL
jgi:hypothetical protein